MFNKYQTQASNKEEVPNFSEEGNCSEEFGAGNYQTLNP